MIVLKAGTGLARVGAAPGYGAACATRFRMVKVCSRTDLSSFTGCLWRPRVRDTLLLREFCTREIRRRVWSWRLGFEPAT
jgi:hypothetical protein